MGFSRISASLAERGQIEVRACGRRKVGKQLGLLLKLIISCCNEESESSDEIIADNSTTKVALIYQKPACHRPSLQPLAKP